uniref:Uncharacterized protein n=1 Tax=Triticum urartu TaxID=4572 RepID=A0A8R7PYJ6_TRIUA
VRGREHHAPGGGVLVEPAGGGEDEQRDLGVAEERELEGLLEEPRAALGEAHLPARPVLDPPQLHTPAPRHRPPPASSGCRSSLSLFGLLELGRIRECGRREAIWGSGSGEWGTDERDGGLTQGPS